MDTLNGFTSHRGDELFHQFGASTHLGGENSTNLVRHPTVAMNYFTNLVRHPTVAMNYSTNLVRHPTVAVKIPPIWCVIPPWR